MGEAPADVCQPSEEAWSEASIRDGRLLRFPLPLPRPLDPRDLGGGDGERGGGVGDFGDDGSDFRGDSSPSDIVERGDLARRGERDDKAPLLPLPLEAFLLEGGDMGGGVGDFPGEV